MTAPAQIAGAMRLAVEQSQAVFGAGTRNYLGSVGVEHVTQGIAGNQCAHGDATHGNGRGAHAALHGPLHAKNLADHGAGASAYIALGRIIARCGGTGGIDKTEGSQIGPGEGQRRT